MTLGWWKVIENHFWMRQPPEHEGGISKLSKTIQAVYENGVFRPIEPLDLPEHTEVEFDLRIKRTAAPDR